MILRKLFIALLFVGIPGCSDPRQSTKEIPNLTTFSLESVPEIALTRDEDFRGSQNAEINKIGDIAVDEEGNVYFVDEYKQKVQVVDAEGNPTGTMGRAGGRPGEFRKLGDIEVVNGILYAFDEDRKAINAYSTNDFKIKNSTAFSTPDFGVDSLESASPFIGRFQKEGVYLVGYQVVESPENRRLYFYQVNADGEIISDQILAFQNKPLFVDDGPDGMIIMMMPYERETLWQTDAEGNIYTLYTDQMLIRTYDVQGNYREAWNYPIKKVKLNKADAIDLYEEVDIRRAIRGDNAPGEWPAVASLLMDDENRLWVATITPNLKNYRWYVINGDGSSYGTFELPRSVEIKAIRKGEIYAREFNRRTYAEEVIRFQIH